MAGRPPDGVWVAPGRVNLIGEHTDYNDGFVLPFALSQRVSVAAARRRDRNLTVVSRQQPDRVTIDLDGLAPGLVTGWGAYVAGVAWALQARGYAPSGADLLIESDVPIGAGLSSSAALECAVAAALDGLAGFGLPAVDLAQIAQTAENDFVGFPCGLMDQMVSMTAIAGHALFLDTRSLLAEAVPFDPSRAGLTLIVVNTNAPHLLVYTEYAERRRACELAARLLKVRSLRDVTPDQLDAALSGLRDATLGRRVRHVVTENARVLATVDRLRVGDVHAIGPLLSASHQSLRDDFEVSSARLDVAVTAALSAGALGARLTGAGFGGCAIALAPVEAADDIVTNVAEAFRRRRFGAPTCFAAKPSAGAHQVW
ncbi:MAG TPA: galactokinase [Acidimicrobiales bacterium]|nr:galactokinase [Acidimicrobiales bacterium]